MNRLLAALDRVLVLVAAAALITMTGITTVSVTGRYLLNMPIPDDLVMSELLMVFVVFLPFAYVQGNRGHHFVSVFTDWLPRRWQQIFDAFGILLGLMFFGILATATFDDFSSAWSVGAYVEGPLELPEWPSRFAVFLGILVMFVRLVWDLIATVSSLKKTSC